VGQCHPDTDVETKVSAIFNPGVTEMWLRVVQEKCNNRGIPTYLQDLVVAFVNICHNFT
jgi:hypothetical protein